MGTALWGQRCYIQWWNTPERTVQHATTAGWGCPTTGHNAAYSPLVLVWIRKIQRSGSRDNESLKTWNNALVSNAFEYYTSKIKSGFVKYWGCQFFVFFIRRTSSVGSHFKVHTHIHAHKHINSYSIFSTLALFYYLEYSNDWPHLYCCNQNVSAEMSFGLLQMFHVKLEIPHIISNWTLYLNDRGRLFQFC